MNVPFADLRAQYKSLKGEINAAIQSVVDDCAFIGGKYTKKFEEEFAEFCGVDHCVGVGNGTDAIYVVLRALGVGKGDEVITAANSFVASSEAITMTGARVVFVDCDPVSYNLDAAKLENAISKETRAILPIHLYGQPADMNAVNAIADKYSLFVVEDAAQAHGAEFEGRRVGTLGNAACFSFYPGKNLGAYGDAGAIVTGDEELAKKCRMIANHGRISKYDHEFEGVNTRLDGVQAAILSVKLNHLHPWTEARRAAAARYSQLLKGANLVVPKVPDNIRHVYHLYVVQTDNRDAIREGLANNEIASGIHYPIGLPYLQAYRYMRHTAEDFPVTYGNQSRLLSLPIFPEISDEQIEQVCDQLLKLTS